MCVQCECARVMHHCPSSFFPVDEPFDLERYESTLRICELLRDREILAGGDDCELGDNGINISMGQKQR